MCSQSASTESWDIVSTPWHPAQSPNDEKGPVYRDVSALRSATLGLRSDAARRVDHEPKRRRTGRDRPIAVGLKRLWTGAKGESGNRLSVSHAVGHQSAALGGDDPHRSIVGTTNDPEAEQKIWRCADLGAANDEHQ